MTSHKIAIIGFAKHQINHKIANHTVSYLIKSDMEFDRRCYIVADELNFMCTCMVHFG